jgi:hypothetical protein
MHSHAAELALENRRWNAAIMLLRQDERRAFARTERRYYSCDRLRFEHGLSQSCTGTAGGLWQRPKSSERGALRSAPFVKPAAQRRCSRTLSFLRIRLQRETPDSFRP